MIKYKKNLGFQPDQVGVQIKKDHFLSLKNPYELNLWFHPLISQNPKIVQYASIRKSTVYFFGDSNS